MTFLTSSTQTAVAGLSLVALFAGVPPGQAQTSGEKGLAIAQEMDRRDSGWGDNKVHLTMVLKNRQGDTSTLKLRMNILESPAAQDGDKSLVVFDQPRDVAGTAFLSFTHVSDADDQWLFLPAIKRVKRISSANKSGPFMGSEFAYEDLLSQEAGKYTHRWLRDESCGELECFVIERYPTYENSGYSRQVVWIDQNHYRPLRINYYDRKDSLLKSLSFSDYKLYLGRFWRAHAMVMENHQTGKSTTIMSGEHAFQAGVNERYFNPNALERVR